MKEDECRERSETDAKVLAALSRNTYVLTVIRMQWGSEITYAKINLTHHCVAFTFVITKLRFVNRRVNARIIRTHRSWSGKDWKQAKLKHRVWSTVVGTMRDISYTATGQRDGQ